MRDDRRLIEQEDWHTASGITVKEGEENSATAPRNYNVECNGRYVIAVIKGYHIWWCSAHHQPLTHCREMRTQKIELEMLKRNRR
jgi:hypothetical protein